MRVGYVRVSTADQNAARQIADLVDVEKLFTDQASGKDTARPQLEEMLGFVRDGDTVVVHSMDRLARNLDDLRQLVKTMTSKGVQVEFVKEQLTFTGDDAPLSTLLLSVMGAFAEFERAIIRERQREGIAAAKKKGKFKGRAPALTAERRQALVAAAADGGTPKGQLAKQFGISRQTLYRYLAADA